MKIVFDKCDNETGNKRFAGYYQVTAADSRENGGYYGYFQSHVRENILNRLLEHFDDAFLEHELISDYCDHFANSGKQLYIKFLREEDENLFLLLTNDGIEI